MGPFDPAGTLGGRSLFEQWGPGRWRRTGCRRGKKLGGFRAGAKLTARARQKGADANAESAAARAADLAPVITEPQASGATSLRAIAGALNDRGIPTAGGRKWFAASVRDVLARI